MERDLNLLFGVFAVQLRKVSPSQIMAAAGAWAADQSKELPERLIENGALAQGEVELIQRLVNEAVHAHGGDAAATLRTFGGESQVFASFGGSIALSADGGVRAVPRANLHTATNHYLDAKEVPGVQETPGRYTHVSEYGRGGMGRVLLVHDAFLGRDVALKELLPGPSPMASNDPSTGVRRLMGFLSRFLLEARITGQLEHPSIVPVYELGHRPNGTLYYTMKLVRGKTLREAIQKCSTLQDRLNLLSNFIGLCQAVAYAHSRGIIHRDLKPDNVMVGEFGETVVLDWGLAKAKDREDVHADGLAETLRLLSLGDLDSAAKTQYGQVMGTPAYMPPEQAKGQLEWVDERSDIYSLGAVLYELLSGKPPFSGSGVEIIRKVITENPRPITQHEVNVPIELSAICSRAMQKEPGRRYQSTRELADEIQRFQSGALVRAHTYTSIQLVRWFVRRFRPLLVGASAVFIIGVLVTAIYLYRITQINQMLTEARSNEATQRQAAEDARHHAESTAYFAGISQAHANLEDGNFSLARAALTAVPSALRGWEWGHLYEQSLDHSLVVLPVNSGAVLCAEYSRDGSRIVTASLDGAGYVWDANSGKKLVSLKGTGEGLVQAEFSPRGDRVITVTAGGNARVFDANSGTELIGLVGHKGEVNDAQYSPDGTRVVTASDDATAKLWEAESGKLLATFRAHKGEVWTAGFSPDGGRIVTASDDGKAIVWNAADGKAIAALTGHTGFVVDALFSPNGQHVVTASRDGSARLWDAKSGKELVTLAGHSDWVNSASFDPNGDRIVTASDDNTARVWDPTSGRILMTLGPHDGYVSQARFSPTGDQIVTISTDGTAKVWDANTGDILASLRGHSDSIHHAAFSPDGLRIVTASADGRAKVWDANFGGDLNSACSSAIPTGCMMFSSDSRHIIAHTKDGLPKICSISSRQTALELPEATVFSSYCADGTRLLTLGKDHVVSIWNTSGAMEPMTLATSSENEPFIVFGSKGNRVLLREQSGQLGVWETESGRKIATLAAETSPVTMGSFSPDGGRVVTAGGEPRALLWDANTGVKIAELAGHPSNITSVSFSQNGSRVVLAYEDGRAEVWDIVSASELVTLEGHTSTVYSAVFDPSDSRIVTGSNDKTARVWDAESGTVLTTLEGHTDSVSGVSFSPDGRRILTASKDNTVRVWESRSGTPLMSLTGHVDWITGASFSPDGTTIASSSVDGKLMIWTSVPWLAAKWLNDSDRAETLRIALRQDAQSIGYRLDPLRGELDPVFDSLDRVSKEWSKASEHKSDIVRGVPSQGVILGKAPSIPHLPLKENDLIVSVNSLQVFTVPELANHVANFVKSAKAARNTPQQFSLGIVNEFDYKVYALEFPGVVEQEISAPRKLFALRCKVMANEERSFMMRRYGKVVKGDARMGSAEAQFFNLEVGDILVDWDGHAVSDNEAAVHQYEAHHAAATSGTLTQSILTILRPSTGQYIRLTIQLR